MSDGNSHSRADDRRRMKMKCAMDFTKRSLAEAWTDLGNGPSVWLLPSGGQFYTRSCTRCARLLPHAWSHVPERNGEPNAQDLRCVQLSLIHISEPTRLLSISYAVFC